MQSTVGPQQNFLMSVFFRLLLCKTVLFGRMAAVRNQFILYFCLVFSF